GFVSATLSSSRKSCYRWLSSSARDSSSARCAIFAASIPALTRRISCSSASIPSSLVTPISKRNSFTPICSSASPRCPASFPPPTALDEAYSHSAPVPLVVNESFARKYLEDKNPVGLHMGNADRGNIPDPGPGYTIVGVVGDTKYAQLRRKTAPIIFLPLVRSSAHFELRIAANPTALVK